MEETDPKLLSTFRGMQNDYLQHSIYSLKLHRAFSKTPQDGQKGNNKRDMIVFGVAGVSFIMLHHLCVIALPPR